ncbi:SAM-dependent methyltransferase [Planctomycetales bacterium]|nr:SAM-dependent methyltransferase [Planctomycetales bacterium]
MFIFSACQVGCENVFKKEIKRLFPSWRSAFSRQGFITFKIENEYDNENDVSPVGALLEQSVFARSTALSIGKIETDNTETLAETVWQLVKEHQFFVNRVHCFQRDPFPPGEKGFEPHLSQRMIQVQNEIIKHSRQPKLLAHNASDMKQPAIVHDTVLDVVEVDPNQWMIGIHRVSETSPVQALYCGGVIPIQLPENAVSRAWLKFEEGLRWSGFNIKPDNVCLDIGSAPGGGSQVLLERNAKVFGIDPAEMASAVMRHPRFVHLRGRIKSIKRSILDTADWVFADMNVAPNYTLDVIEETATLSGNAKGFLFTLKLVRWELAEKIPQYLDRLRKMGFRAVRAKQLAFNRQEIMVAAKR